MQCPICDLESPPTAETCDCGYKLSGPHNGLANVATRRQRAAVKAVREVAAFVFMVGVIYCAYAAFKIAIN